MARPKKNVTENKINQEQQSQLQSIESKQKTYQELESELNELKNMMKSLLQNNTEQSQQINTQNQIQQPINSTKSHFQQSYEPPIVNEQYIGVHPNKRIKVISLYDGLLILVAGQYNQGKPYRFTKYGETKNIVYSELAEILHYQNSFAEKGYFYICDDNVVSYHGLYDAYQNILSKDVIDNLLNYDKKEIIELFKRSTKNQQEEISSLIAKKIANDEEVDLNKIKILSDIANIDIVQIANDYKFLQNSVIEN